MKQSVTTLKLLTSALTLSLATLSVIAAPMIPDGDYKLVIIPTPLLDIFGDGSVYYPDYGTQATGWNSSFTFGGIPLAGDSRGMGDNDIVVPTAAVGDRGSSIGGDGYSGVLGMSVQAGTIAVTSFSVDAVLATAGGNFVQHTTSVADMVGTVDDAGNMTLTLAGRLGTIATFATLYDKRWNYNDSAANLGAPYWAPFTTGTSQSDAIGLGGGPDAITGVTVTNIGDVNGDTVDDYSLTLVSASNVGADWGGFNGVPFAEIWNAQILSNTVDVPTSNDGAVTAAVGLDVITTESALISAGVAQDEGMEVACNPDCADLMVASNAGVATVVIPLTAAIPADSIFRVNVGGVWQDLDTSAGDSIASAAGVLGHCPLPGSAIYTSPATAGDYCVQLSIADAGVNDNDAVADQVTLLGGFAQGIVIPEDDQGENDDSNGDAPATDNGSLDLIMLLTMLCALGLIRKKLS